MMFQNDSNLSPRDKLGDNRDDDDNGDNRYSLGTPSASRARMLALEREKQIKKRQSSVQKEGMVRSSLNNKPQGQFTPAIRQFSTPKNIKNNFADDEDNGNDDNIPIMSEQISSPSPIISTYKGNIGRNQRFHDPEDNDDDDDDAQENGGNNVNHETSRMSQVKAQKINSKNYNDDNNNNDDDDNDNNYNSRNRANTTPIIPTTTTAIKANYIDDDSSDDSEDFNRYKNRFRSSTTAVPPTTNTKPARPTVAELSDDGSDNDEGVINKPQTRPQVKKENRGSYRDDSDEDDEDNSYPRKSGTNTTMNIQKNNNNNTKNSTDNWANNNANNSINKKDTQMQKSMNRQYEEESDDSRRYNNTTNTTTSNNYNNKSRGQNDSFRSSDKTSQQQSNNTNNTNTSTSMYIHKSILDVIHSMDLKEFLMKPVPKECGIVQCYIRRNRNGSNKLYPIYSIYLKEDNIFMMSSKKRPNNTTSNYLISMAQNDLNRDSVNYLGKVRSNFMGTEFQIFDNGVNPQDEIPSGPLVNKDIRKELGSVIYAANVLGSRGPRKMQVAIPEVDEDDNVATFRPSLPAPGGLTRSGSFSAFTRRLSFRSSNTSMMTGGSSMGGGAGGPPVGGTPRGGDDIITRIKEKNFRDLCYYENKKPKWNDHVGAYVLNFNGRVTMASVKNFQLVDPDMDDNIIILQFGKVDKDDFTMDLQWPMSPFQAFAITLSSFDSKIACD